MTWKRLLKYTAGLLFISSIILLYWADRQGTSMYGGLTQEVDHSQFQAPTGSFAISNVNVLSAEGSSFLAAHTVLIEDGLITAIDSNLILPENIRTIDGSGKYLIPGLIDAHVHLFQSPNDLLLYLANGVTQIRELIGSEEHLQWKQEIDNGRIGPQMFVASPRLGSFGTLEGWMMEKSQGFLNIPNAEVAEQKVKELYEQGYDGLKIYSHLNKESYEAICQTAKSLKMPVFGHIPFVLKFEDIWQSGQSDIAHFEEVMNALQREFGDGQGEGILQNFHSFKNKEEAFLAYIDQRSDAIADSLLAHDISVTSTLWLTQSFLRQKVELDQVLTEVELAYENPGISEGSPMVTRALGWLPSVNRYRFYEGLTEEEKEGQAYYWQTYGDACQLLAKNLSARGVKIMAGTDANLPPTVPGFSLHDELISLNEAGMSPAQVLQAATRTPANWLNSNTGTIQEGLAANLVLLDRNPLEDISNTKAINTVINQGKVYDRTLLDQLLAAVKAANDASRKVDIGAYEQ